MSLSCDNSILLFEEPLDVIVDLLFEDSNSWFVWCRTFFFLLIRLKFPARFYRDPLYAPYPH
ncbi:hypothetical protein C1H46_000187 [Malus baccata]|uniref:Uncharacterized protein n=1 Tax=Malus baccata TaxID=106549 RepID=A0A540NT98_MALBA|nr:hypothetical protein C1H46_000187 [Malus baccata]